MADFTNEAKSADATFTNEPKRTGNSKVIGEPIGILLAFTEAVIITGDTSWVNITKS